MADPTIICLTPVRDESWILERFLAAASVWADHIVVADQRSTDGSREIALRHPRVVLVDNPSEFDELTRQRLLLRTARELTGDRRILIALDADEAFTTPALAGPGWERALAARPGTALRWRWANVFPEGRSVWIPPALRVFGVVDDGRERDGPRIHGVRVPVGEGAPTLDGGDGDLVLHLQYLSWERMKRKQAWYQCWETLEDPSRRPTAIYRQYHHMDAVPAELVRAFDPDWVEGYRRLGIDLTSTPADLPAWWDREVLDWLLEHGSDRFAKIDLWDVDWAAVAGALGHPLAESGVRDPRTAVDRAVVRWLAHTQRLAGAMPIRVADRGLRLVGW